MARTMSNSGGPSGAKGMSKGGTKTPNSRQVGSDGVPTEASADGHGSKGPGSVRVNGLMPAGLGGSGDAQNYKKAYASNKDSMAPKKTGGIR